MSKRQIYDFLRDLTENNSKDWMDAHRERYEAAKQLWVEECDHLLARLKKHDARYEPVTAKDTIERINNNLMYHAERPTYKSHFGFAPNQQKGGGFYVSLSPTYSFIAGGYHNPDSKDLKAIRAAIDERGEELLKILKAKRFKKVYGGLEEDPSQLKTSPRGYDVDHSHIELLRRKQFTASHRISQNEVLSDEFPDIIEQSFLAIKPLNDFLLAAVGR